MRTKNFSIIYVLSSCASLKASFEASFEEEVPQRGVSGYGGRDLGPSPDILYKTPRRSEGVLCGSLWGCVISRRSFFFLGYELQKKIDFKDDYLKSSLNFKYALSSSFLIGFSFYKDAPSSYFPDDKNFHHSLIGIQFHLAYATSYQDFILFSTDMGFGIESVSSSLLKTFSLKQYTGFRLFPFFSLMGFFSYDYKFLEDSFKRDDFKKDTFSLGLSFLLGYFPSK